MAVVCSSNMNRSMEAHSVLAKKNFLVSSYGTGNQIKIPGKSKYEPNIYPFGEAIFLIYYLGDTSTCDGKFNDFQEPPTTTSTKTSAGKIEPSTQIWECSISWRGTDASRRNLSDSTRHQGDHFRNNSNFHNGLIHVYWGPQP